MKWLALMAFLIVGADRGKAGPVAVILRVDGNITIDQTVPRNKIRSLSLIRRARFLQVVGAGDEIHVPPGAKAEVVCSSDHWLLLTEGLWRLKADLCSKGRALPPGVFQGLAPSGGRMRSLEGALVLERDTRTPGSEIFGAPTLLSPRNTAVLAARPTILWTAVPDATEYEIELVGPGAFRITLDAAQVECGPAEGWGEEAVCSSPWPSTAVDLVRGEPVFLSVGARLGLGSPLRKEEGINRVTRPGRKEAKRLRERLKELQALPIHVAARELLAADLYAREGCLADASIALRKAADSQGAPESRITLGDTWLAMGLLRLAAHSYAAVSEREGGPEYLAAAEFGMGRVEYGRGFYKLAAQHFEKAGQLYDLLGMTDESLAARRGLRLAKERLQ